MKKVLLILILLTLLSGCADMAVMIGCAFDDPIEDVPAKEFGQFAVKLDYLHAGKEVEINDTLSCTYQGRACDGRGLHNQWAQKLEKHPIGLVLKTINDKNELSMPLASCKQLMEGNLDHLNIPIHKVREGSLVTSSRASQSLLAKHGIKINIFEVTKKP